MAEKFIIDKKLTAHENLVELINYDNETSVGEKLKAEEIKVIPSEIVEPEGYSRDDDIEYGFSIADPNNEEDRVDGLTQTRLSVNDHAENTVESLAWYANTQGLNDLSNPHAPASVVEIGEQASEIEAGVKAALTQKGWNVEDKTLFDGFSVDSLSTGSESAALLFNLTSLMFRHKTKLSLPLRLVDLTPNFNITPTYSAEDPVVVKSTPNMLFLDSMVKANSSMQGNTNVKVGGVTLVSPEDESKRVVEVTKETLDPLLPTERPAKFEVTALDLEDVLAEPAKAITDEDGNVAIENIGTLVDGVPVLDEEKLKKYFAGIINLESGYTFELVAPSPARARSLPTRPTGYILHIGATLENPVFYGTARFGVTEVYGLKQRVLTTKLGGFNNPQVVDGGSEPEPGKESIEDALISKNLEAYRE